MTEVAVVGLDLAKNLFQVHGVGEVGVVVLGRQLRRSHVATTLRAYRRAWVGMEACASANHWARLLRAMGHQVRLVPPTYVKRGKTNAADAKVIARVVTRPTMRFVAVKTIVQQAVLMLNKTLDLLVRQRTMTINALWGNLCEFGVVAPQDAAGVRDAI